MQFILSSHIIPAVTRALAATAQLTSFSRECISSSPGVILVIRRFTVACHYGDTEPRVPWYPLVTPVAAILNFSLARTSAHTVRQKEDSRVVAGRNEQVSARCIDDTAKIDYDSPRKLRGPSPRELDGSHCIGTPRLILVGMVGACKVFDRSRCNK